VAESGIRFEDRGTHRLKGVPDGWRLYRVLKDCIVVVEDKTSASIPNLRTAGRGEGRLEAVRRLFLRRYGSGLRQGLGSTLFFSSPWGVALVLMRGKHLLRQAIKSGDNRLKLLWATPTFRGLPYRESIPCRFRTSYLRSVCRRGIPHRYGDQW